jgi:hypothetical protein
MADPMPFADKVFLAELALFGGAFGTGSFMVFESSHIVAAAALAIIGIAGIGASLIDHFPAEAKQRNRFLITAVLGVGIWALLGYDISVRYYYPAPESSTAIPTQIRWQFVGGRQTPTVLYENNIAAWYTLWSPSIELEGRDKKGNVVGRAATGPYWTIFLTFKHPVTYQQLTLVSPNISSYEVKQTNTGSAVIVVNQDIPAGFVEVSTVP